MAERRMFSIEEQTHMSKPTRREILANLGQEGALDRPAIPRNEFFDNNNIARIVEKVQDNIPNMIVDKNFVHEVLELMKCIHKSRPNFQMELNELNSVTVENILHNIQCGDKINTYKEPAEIQSRKPSSYLYDVKYIPKQKKSEFADVRTASSLSQKNNVLVKEINPITTVMPRDIPTSTLYSTSKQTNNYREFFVHIDSRDRDVFAYPSANRYAIKLLSGLANSGFVSDLDQRHVKDVVEVRLIDAIIPNIFVSSTALPNYKQSYIFMSIDEFGGESYSTNRSGRRLFGKLRFALGSLPIPQISFVNMECEGCVRKWWYKDPRGEYQNNQTPYPKLDTMTINLLDYDGLPFNFGQDTLSIISITPVGPLTHIETASPHGLATNDLIYLRNVLNPVPPLGDGLVNGNLTTSSGFLVNSIVTSTEITIQFDSNSLGPFRLQTAMLVKANLQHSLTFMIRSIGGS
jgi:hypothetical protein